MLSSAFYLVNEEGETSEFLEVCKIRKQLTPGFKIEGVAGFNVRVTAIAKGLSIERKVSSRVRNLQ